MSAERAVRAKALAVLGGDSVLAGLVHGVFDGVPPRATMPIACSKALGLTAVTSTP